MIDTANNAVTARIPVDSASIGVAVTPDGTKVYVANRYSLGYSNVSVIDTARNTVTATIPVGIQAAGVAVAPDGTKVYVANQVSNTVSVIDTASNAVTATIPVGTAPTSFGIFMAASRCGLHFYCP